MLLDIYDAVDDNDFQFKINIYFDDKNIIKFSYYPNNN